MEITYFNEIKNRISILFITWISLFIIGFIYKKPLMFFFIKPYLFFFQKYHSFYFIYTHITELFLTYLKLIFFITNYITFLMGIFQTIVFNIPGLYAHEYKKQNLYLFWFSFFWIIVVFINYKILIPLSWGFFFNFQENLSNTITINNSFYFEAKFSKYVEFFVEFQLICITIFLFIFLFYIIGNKIKYKIQFTIKFRKIIFLFIFISAALITPPNIENQLIIGFFLITVYEIIVFYLCIFKHYLYSFSFICL
jgi:sec-independent protein translocase protein TatC